MRNYGSNPQLWDEDPDCVHDWQSERYYTERSAGQSSGEAFSEAGPANAKRLKEGRWRDNSTCAKCGAWRGELGSEPTPDLYVQHIVAVFREVKRVLRADGTCFVNLGDCYARNSNKGEKFRDKQKRRHWQHQNPSRLRGPDTPNGMKEKDLVGIPWSVAFALRADGWYLRAALPWIKRNVIPESVTDRPTTSCEYVFLLAKQKHYFYDAEAVSVPASLGTHARVSGNLAAQVGSFRANGGNKTNGPMKAVVKGSGKIAKHGSGIKSNDSFNAAMALNVPNRNRRSSDWFFDSLQSILDGEQGLVHDEDGEPVAFVVNPQSFKGSHFATYPITLVTPMVLASTSAKGVCQKCGAPWKREVETSGGSIGHSWNDHANDLVTGRRAENAAKGGHGYKRESVGWQPTCTCNTAGLVLLPNDMETIETPIGEMVSEDPSLVTGRAGLNRLRGKAEGKRPITRYEQRKYAAQLKASPHRAAMSSETNAEAFAHYLRTDSAGARPIPGPLLEEWIAAGLLERVEVPDFTPFEPAPAIVFDPFHGSGTTGLAAEALGRRYVGAEIKFEYIDLSKSRDWQRGFQLAI